MECRVWGIHTTIETCGHVPWPAIEAVLPWTDRFLFDLKHLDALEHRTHTGGDVDLIPSNLERVANAAANVTLRVPVIPEFNDAAEDIRAIAQRVVSLGITEMHLLSYHRLGQNKHRLLGRPYGLATETKVSDGMLTRLQAVAGVVGLTVRIGG